MYPQTMLLEKYLKYQNLSVEIFQCLLLKKKYLYVIRACFRKYDTELRIAIGNNMSNRR